MARRAAIEALIRKEAWRISPDCVSVSLFRAPVVSSLRCGYGIIRRNIRGFCSGRRIDDQIIRPSRDENPSSSPWLVAENTEETPTDRRKTKGNGGETVFGSTVIDGSTGEWLTLNEKINTYPSARRFTAIGLGGDDFVRSMVVAVESITQTSVPEDAVKQRVSSGGKYVSVNIGPVRVVSREQVQAVYNAMRSDDRMKFFL